MQKKIWIGLGLLLLILGAGWFSRPVLATRISQQIRDSLTQENAEASLGKLDSWQGWLGTQSSFELARADAYRKLGDAVRVKKHVERAIGMGVDADIASQPLWLQMATNGLLDVPEAHLAQMLQSHRGHESEVYDAFLHGYAATWRLGDGFRTIKQWRELFPKEARTYYWEGAFLGLDYQIEPATLKYKKALELDPEIWEARLRLAELLVEQSKLPEAEEHFASLYKKFPTMKAVCVGYARCLMNEGYSDNALKLLESIDEKSTDSSLLYLKCQAAFEANEAEKADAWLAVLCQRWPEVAPYRELQGRVKELLQKTDDATRSFKIASDSQIKHQEINKMITELDSQPGNIEIRIRLGTHMMYYLSPDAGSAQISSALALSPSNPQAHRLLMDYYRREGRLDLVRRHQTVLERLESSKP